jgi:regulator of sigma E protease
VTGRTPNQKVMEYSQMVGMILLLGLMLYGNGMDIFRAIMGK